MRSLGEILARMTDDERAEFARRDADPVLNDLRSELALAMEREGDGVEDGQEAAKLLELLEAREAEIIDSYLAKWR